MMPVKTTSGRFKLEKTDSGIRATHIQSGLGVGGFSHIAVKTLRHAREGMEAAERTLSKSQWKSLDAMHRNSEITPQLRAAMKAFKAAMKKEFSNGAWDSQG
jgi:hypothetical protein